MRALERISYVEDDEDIQRIVQLALERIGGMAVDCVSDPGVAIERVAAFRPDLVVLDWMMPGMDGPTLFRRLRDHPATRHLPVVFVTAKASETDLEALRALGAAGTLPKPFSLTELPDRLRAIWASVQASQQPQQ